MHEQKPQRTTVLTVPFARNLQIRLPRLGLNISERRILLAIVDLIFVNLAMITAMGFGVKHNVRSANMILWLLLLSAIWFAVGSLFDIYDLRKAASPIHSLWAASGTVLVAVAVYLLIPFITPGLPDRRLQILIFTLVALMGVTTWRLAYATVLSQPQFHRSVLIVGAGWAGRTLASAIAENAHKPGNPVRGTGYHIIGYVDDDPEKQDLRVAGIPVLGTGDELIELVDRFQPDDLVVAINHTGGMRPELIRNLMTCYESGMNVTTMSGLYQRVTGRVPIDHAGSNLAVILPTDRTATYRFYRITKRLIDWSVGAAGCAVTLLLVPPLWLANRLLSPGDLFFRQTRVGIAGKPYEIIKFRSMMMDAEKQSGAVWATEDDPRITPVGRWLRRMRLDELPQCRNMFVGNMSLIGPRPERPEFVDQLKESIPYYSARHAVKPGLTGWAQIKYRYGASADDARIKLEYDLYYIKNQGFFMDLSILLKTVLVVLGFRGR